MKLIKANFNIIEQGPSIDGIYKIIEQAGRVCYKSEDKITETSAKEFVDRMIKSGHGAMLEHGTVYLQYEVVKSAINPLTKYYLNKYSKVKAKEGAIGETMRLFVTTNLRVLVENDWLKDLEYICEPTEYHERRVTIHFVCDRGVSHEFVRHRVFSFAQESTRYCNYSKDKFQGVTYIQPPWLDGDISNEDGSRFNDVYTDTYLHTLTTAENAYLDLLKQWDNKVPDKRFKSGYKNNPWTPQQARAVLPNALKTELVMTGFVSDWEHFFKLRDAGNAHPQARELAHPLHMEFLRRNYLVDLYDEANPD
jgi:thymidylate synthase (FAD)